MTRPDSSSPSLEELVHVTRWTAVAGVAGVLAAGPVGAPSSALAAASGPAGWCTAPTLSAERVPAAFRAADCPGLTVLDGPTGAEVPPRGQAVSAAALTESGPADLTLVHGEDGVVRVHREDERDVVAPQAGPAPEAAPAACADPAYVRLPYRFPSYRWSYNNAGAPAAVRARAPAAMRTATAAITTATNDCGIDTDPRVSSSFAGSTSRGAQVTAAGCGGNDGASVTSWLALPTGVLARTCTYYQPSSGLAIASDAGINTGYGWYTGSTRGCRGAFDLVGVMTHERGHTFGLGHPSPYSAHARLTMAAQIAPCDSSKRTLGRGDVRGLIAIYGRR